MAEKNTANIGFEKQIWDAACVLWGHIPAAEYRKVIVGLIFLRYISSAFEKRYNELVADGDGFEDEPDAYMMENIFFVPEKARWSAISAAAHTPEIGTVIDDAMRAIEDENKTLKNVLPKNYASPDLDKRVLGDVVDLFTNMDMTDTEDSKDLLGRTYEYCIAQFAAYEGVKGGEFYTPSSVVRTLVEILRPFENCRVYDPACGSGGMFVQSGDFVNAAGMNANAAMTFYGQEKVEYNAQLCLMNMAVHGLTGVIKSGDEANTFYHDAHNLNGCCDYVMANPPFNVDKVKSETAQSAGRLPFGLPSVNAKKEISNANYLWISYFYSYLNEHGRAGFVMASSATDSQGKDKDIRQALIETGHVDVMISVGNNFFYTKSLPCSLWFFDRAKADAIRDKVLFIDARNYYTVVDRTLNEWSEWQLRNLNAIVWLYRGEIDKYKALLQMYREELGDSLTFAERAKQLKDDIRNCKDEARFVVAETSKKYQKQKQAEYDDRVWSMEQKLSVAKEALWLYEKFGEGEYADVPGLCKVADLAEIEGKGWSLTPGAYVGVAPVEDDGVDFAARMAEIHRELLSLQAESNALMETISKNWEEMGV